MIANDHFLFYWSLKGWCRWGTQRRWRRGWRRCQSQSRRQQRGRARCWIVSELQCNRRNWWDDPARVQSCYWQTESQSGACARHHRSDTHVYPSYPKAARSLGEQVQPCICTLHLMIHLYTLSKYIIEFLSYLFFETCSTVWQYFITFVAQYCDI